MSERHETDQQYEEYNIVDVSKSGDDSYYLLKLNEGGYFSIPDVGVVPKVGQIARLYGKGFGYAVRGVAIDGQIVYYRTEAEEAAFRADERAKQDIKRRTEYDAQSAEFDKRVNALPEPFKTRILDFRAYNPNWAYEYEPYELFVCEQAVAIADALKDVAKIVEFHKSDSAKQKEMVPALSDDHSGNTFGAACLLARCYLSNPDLVPKMHGALCPLVGCKSYGCFAARNKSNEIEPY